MKRPEFVSATQEQLDELLALARKASFPQPQYELLAGVLGTFIYVMQALQNAKMSLQRFRRLLFGARTESLANVFKESECDAGRQDDPAGVQIAATPDESPEPANPDKKKMKGHGRNGTDVYRSAPVVEIAPPIWSTTTPGPRNWPRN